jgi:hypothetical protein
MSKEHAMPSLPRFLSRFLLRRLAMLCAGAALAACGAEVAGTAAGVAAAEAAQASQARAQQAKIVDGIKQSQDAAVARSASAADEAGK